jgi:type III pantothenate kinase
MNLLLDLGNTRLKWAFAQDEKLSASSALAWRVDGFAERLLAELRDGTPPCRVLAAAVADDTRRAMVTGVLRQLGWPTPEWLHSPACLGEVINAYIEPSRLGIDRFLMLLAAWHAGLAPCVIAGCGSALTLDALAVDGRHLGGLIVPGVAAMRNALSIVAPVLPQVEGGRVLDFADNTEDAVASGAWQAAAGAIERFAAHARKQLGHNARLLLAGGDAAAIATLLDQPVHVLPDAVLRGLLVWSRASETGAAPG